MSPSHPLADKELTVDDFFSAGHITIEPYDHYYLSSHLQKRNIVLSSYHTGRKRRYLGRYFAHPMMRNRLAKRDDYKASAVLVTQRSMP